MRSKMIDLPHDLGTLIAGQPWTRNDNGESGGAVFRIGEGAYLKHGVGRVASDIIDEHARLRWLCGRIAVPRILYFCAIEDAAWLLSSAMPGRLVEDVLDDTPAARVETVRALATFLREMHALPAAECPFNADHRFRLAHAWRNVEAGLVDESDFDPNHQGWTSEQVWGEVTSALPLPFERVVTHGDFSTCNIFIEGGRVTGCIDVGGLGLADPYQDLGILWNNLGDYGPELQAELLSSYGLAEPDMARLRFHVDLDELF